jgi:hypothetical protein
VSTSMAPTPARPTSATTNIALWSVLLICVSLPLWGKACVLLVRVFAFFLDDLQALEHLELVRSRALAPSFVGAMGYAYPSRQRLIHPSAWNRNSRKVNFRFTEF